MSRLDKLTQVEANLVGAETLTELKRTGRAVDGMSVAVKATNVSVQEAGMMIDLMSAQVGEVQGTLEKLVFSVNDKTQDSREKGEALQGLLKQVLRPSKVDSAQEWLERIHKARVPGTGDWIHSEDVFQSWITDETPTIFVSGNPGSGKSFLAANMIGFLLNQILPALPQNPLVSIGYYFFRDDKPETRSFHQALRDIAFQISKNDPGYRKYLETIEEYEQISTLESAWRLLFVGYFLKKPNIESAAYILLDAVDEALDEDWKIFVDLAKDLYGNQSSLRLAIVGRPYIRDQLLEGLEVNLPTLHVTKQKNSKDITQYIHVSIRKSLILRRVSTKLRDEIVDKLSVRAEGMFLWVNLMLQELAKKRNETSMRKALEKAPWGLNEMLRHVLATFAERSDEEELEYLNETLLWVTCASQPWRLGEIEAILRLKSPEGDGMIDLEGALRRQWASFFSLDREDGLTTADLENGSADLNAFNWSADKDQQCDYETTKEDYLMAFNSKKDTTTVNFCHASIGDFFRNDSEGKIAPTETHIGVGVNYHEANAHILSIYLRLITNSDFATKANDSGHMLQYAARHWGDHLLTTSLSNCSLENRREIAKMLLTVFRSEESISKWLGESDWALTTATIRAVQQWWQEQDVLELLSLEEKEFILTTNEKPLNLFQPMIAFCIKRWLCEDLPNPLPMVSIVWRYQMLLRGEEIPDHDRSLTAEDVVMAAEFGGFEKCGQWFKQCAIALREFCCYEEALEYFEKAMELDPHDWRTLRELAQTYQEQDDWQKSLELWKRTRVSLLTATMERPEDRSLKEHLHGCLERMCQIYQEQGNREKRFEVVQEAYQYAPSCWACIHALLEYHNENHAFEASMDLLKKLADTPVPEEDYSELIRFLLVNVFDVDSKSRLAADAASATNDLDFVLRSLQTAAMAARAASRTLIAAEVDMSIARIFDEFLFDHQKAIGCWEKIMDTYSSSSEGTLIGTIRQLASSNLAQAFLCNAIEAGIGTPEAEVSVSKLEKLTQENQACLLGSCAFVPAVYLGIYCRLRGQDERARALFQPSLKRSIQAISDGNPRSEELSDLQHTLMRTGDLKNIVAIAHRSEQDNSDPWYICHGPCRSKVSRREGFSICPICLGKEICPACAGKLVEGEMPKKRCHSQHVEYFISITPQSKEVRGGTMLVDGEEMEFTTWLDQLKEEWDLGACNPSGSTARQFGLGDFLLGLVA
jgi:tetratricopeptide (TPR) repeat protein